MSTPAKKPAAVVNTPAAVEVIIGAAVVDLKRALEAFDAAKEDIATLGQAVDDYTLKINNQRITLASLEQEVMERERQLTVNMEMNLKEKGLVACTEMVRDLGKTIISTEELTKLRSDYQTLQNGYKDDLQKAIGAATNTQSIAHNNALALKTAEHRQEQAENTATINAQKVQITGLETQIKTFTDQLNAEREAGVKRAQANVAPVVNVGAQR